MTELNKKWIVKMRDQVTGEWKEICTTSDEDFINQVIQQLSEDGEECSLEELNVTTE